MAQDEPERIELPTLEEALEEAEMQVMRTEKCNLDQVIAALDCHHPSVRAVWRDTAAISGTLFPIRKVASPAIEDFVDSSTSVGYALVLAACGGFVHCVRRLRSIMQMKHSASILVSRFTRIVN